MLARLAPTQEFAIVDSYLLPADAPADYLPELLSLLEPIARARCAVRPLASRISSGLTSL
ncbi:MAG: hypothetical protein AUH76_04905 [Candidatus Rokubacteria bacterium 13_1_40CM_4_67_11]|nr:MAG: hypothetical protein AUH76_04905 [Candidatus Rokubacteria bacterium 13_1_40CM_4_67_11]